MYEDIEREEPLPSPGARIPSVRVDNDVRDEFWCADSTLIDHVNEIHSRVHRDTSLVRLTCDSIGSRRLNCWSGQVLNV